MYGSVGPPRQPIPKRRDPDMSRISIDVSNLSNAAVDRYLSMKKKNGGSGAKKQQQQKRGGGGALKGPVASKKKGRRVDAYGLDYRRKHDHDPVLDDAARIATKKKGAQKRHEQRRRQQQQDAAVFDASKLASLLEVSSLTTARDTGRGTEGLEASPVAAGATSSLTSRRSGVYSYRPRGTTPRREVAPFALDVAAEPKSKAGAKGRGVAGKVGTAAGYLQERGRAVGAAGVATYKEPLVLTGGSTGRRDRGEALLRGGGRDEEEEEKGSSSGDESFALGAGLGLDQYSRGAPGEDSDREDGGEGSGEEAAGEPRRVWGELGYASSDSGSGGQEYGRRVEEREAVAAAEARAKKEMEKDLFQYKLMMGADSARLRGKRYAEEHRKRLQNQTKVRPLSRHKTWTAEGQDSPPKQPGGKGRERGGEARSSRPSLGSDGSVARRGSGGQGELFVGAVPGTSATPPLKAAASVASSRRRPSASSAIATAMAAASSSGRRGRRGGGREKAGAEKAAVGEAEEGSEEEASDGEEDLDGFENVSYSGGESQSDGSWDGSDREEGGGSQAPPLPAAAADQVLPCSSAGGAAPALSMASSMAGPPVGVRELSSVGMALIPTHRPSSSASASRPGSTGSRRGGGWLDSPRDDMSESGQAYAWPANADFTPPTTRTDYEMHRVAEVARKEHAEQQRGQLRREASLRRLQRMQQIQKQQEQQQQQQRRQVTGNRSERRGTWGVAASTSSAAVAAEEDSPRHLRLGSAASSYRRSSEECGAESARNPLIFGEQAQGQRQPGQRGRRSGATTPSSSSHAAFLPPPPSSYRSEQSRPGVGGWESDRSDVSRVSRGSSRGAVPVLDLRLALGAELSVQNGKGAAGAAGKGGKRVGVISSIGSEASKGKRKGGMPLHTTTPRSSGRMSHGDGGGKGGGGGGKSTPRSGNQKAVLQKGGGGPRTPRRGGGAPTSRRSDRSQGSQKRSGRGGGGGGAQEGRSIRGGSRQGTPSKQAARPAAKKAGGGGRPVWYEPKLGGKVSAAPSVNGGEGGTGARAKGAKAASSKRLKNRPKGSTRRVAGDDSTVAGLEKQVQEMKQRILAVQRAHQRQQGEREAEQKREDKRQAMIAQQKQQAEELRLKLGLERRGSGDTTARAANIGHYGPSSSDGGSGGFAGNESPRRSGRAAGQYSPRSTERSSLW